MRQICYTEGAKLISSRSIQKKNYSRIKREGMNKMAIEPNKDRREWDEFCEAAGNVSSISQDSIPLGDIDEDEPKQSRTAENYMNYYFTHPGGRLMITAERTLADEQDMTYLMIGDSFYPVWSKEEKRRIADKWTKEELLELKMVHHTLYEMLLSRGDLLDYCRIIGKDATKWWKDVQNRYIEKYGLEYYNSHKKEADSMLNESTRHNIINKTPDELKERYVFKDTDDN